MVWKCCVPGCTSSARIPSHRLPARDAIAQAWLKAIGLNDMIDAPQEVKAKLRICGLHFCEDMIISYGQKRRLKDNAMPTLHLDTNIVEDSASISCTNNDTMTTLHTSHNVRSESDFVPETSREVMTINIVRTVNINHLRKKLQRYRKKLHKKSLVIRKNKEKKKRKKNSAEETWDNITAELSGIQKTFMEMIFQNFHHAPQESGVFDAVFLPTLPSLELFNDKLYGEGHNMGEEIQTVQMAHNVKTLNLQKEGHRYEAKQKALALTLYKTMGKRAYSRLRDVFQHIPSRQTLQLALQKIPLTARLNPFVLRHLENISLKMSAKDKVCILMWDEVSIQSSVTYDIRRDIICGLEDWGNNRTSKVADHALVFMLRGLHTGWKMPVSYNFCAKATNTAQLIRCIKEHILKITKAGFLIVATVCDQGSSNVAAIKELLLRTDMKRNFQKRTQAQTFEVGNVEVVPLFDPPHLIKGIRNNFLTKDLAIICGTEKRIASWDVIKTAWLMDKRMNTIRPQLKKITKEHIIEDKIKKMRVKYATQVLSGTVASCIETLTRSKCVVEIEDSQLQIDSEEGIITAEAVLFFNDLFDSVNGSEVSESDLRSPVTKDSAHHTFWTETKQRLKKMCYVHKVTHETITSVPSLKNWLFTIDGFEKIWKIVHLKYDFRILKTRYCNQDPIENFFGQIRSHAVRNTNPTPQQFQDSFVTLLLSNKSVSVIRGNCETAEDSFMLFSLEKCLEENIVNVEVCDVIRNNSEDDEPQEMFNNTVICEESNITYLSEHLDEIIVTLTKKFNYCEECNESFKSSEFPIIARQIVYRVNKLLETRAHWRNILKILLQHFDNWNINMNWHKCIEHNDIFKTIVHVITVNSLTWWCKEKNKLIHNASDLSEDLLCIEDIKKIKKDREAYKLDKRKRKQLLSDYKNKVKRKKK